MRVRRGLDNLAEGRLKAGTFTRCARRTLPVSMSPSCSSTAADRRRGRARPTTTSTRRPRRSSARSPTRRPADMERAIAAARRAFDETDWATNRALRKRVPAAAAGGARQAQGRAAAADRRRGRRPSMLTYAVQQDSCIDDMQWDIDLHRPLRVGVRPRRSHEFFGMTSNRLVANASRSASSARSRRGTSRSCSTCRSSRPRSRPGARSC